MAEGGRSSHDRPSMLPGTSSSTSRSRQQERVPTSGRLGQVAQNADSELSDAPTFGSHGSYRHRQVLFRRTFKINFKEKKPPKGSPDLNNKKVSLDAQERSLRNKLKQVHREEAQWEGAQRKKDAMAQQKKETTAASTSKSTTPVTRQRTTSPTVPKNTVPGLQSGGSVPSQQSGAQASHGYLEETNENMYKTPGRKMRKSGETAEEKEYAERHQEEDGWSTVSSPPGNKVNKVDEIHPESQEAEVSRSPNSTSAWTRPMVSFSTSASAFGTNLDFKNYETATDGDERGLVSKELRKQESFTPGSILPTGTLRKQPEDEDAAVTDRLKPEEIAFLVEEVEKYQDEVEELFLTLNINDPNYKVPTILELCGEENNSITTAMESRGGRGFRCGLFNGREEEWLHQGLQPLLSRTTRRSMGCCALWTNFTHPESQHAHP